MVEVLDVWISESALWMFRMMPRHNPPVRFVYWGVLILIIALIVWRSHVRRRKERARREELRRKLLYQKQLQKKRLAAQAARRNAASAGVTRTASSASPGRTSSSAAAVRRTSAPAPVKRPQTPNVKRPASAPVRTGVHTASSGSRSIFNQANQKKTK